MMLERRTVLSGLGAAAALPLVAAIPAHARSATRTFDLYRSSSRIGSKRLTVALNGADLNVDIAIDIKVRVLGLPAFSYSLRSRETWRDGVLQSLSAQTNDNGTNARVNALREKDGLRVDGSGYQGLVEGNPGTTTYWSPAFLNRSVWISTQDGRPFNVSVSRSGQDTLEGPDRGITATKFAIRGDIGRLDLYFDNGQEFVGSEFDARGEQARFIVDNRGGNLAPLWSSAT